MPRRSYVTTPIYYVNDRPHIGHVYTTTLADVLARHLRQRGDEVFFLTGTDEHAAKVVDAARERGLSPAEWADRNAAAYVETFQRLGFTNDDFIRTSESRHKERVERYVAALLESGDVYQGEYEGWYDPGQEEYVPENKAKEADYKSPITGRPLVKRTETNYFFRLSAYADALREAIESGVFRIEPSARRNEVLGRLREELLDVPISRAGRSDWGIRVPGDSEHTIYVWIDALFNYLSAVDNEERRAFWPPTVQFIGKDILWFHAVIWPALLMALRGLGGRDWLELPRCLYAHSFWTSEGQKMSKSLGNFIDIERLDAIAGHYGLDALRWFLVTQGPLGATDSDFSRRRMDEVYHADLANALGNCASRVISMTARWLDGRVPAQQADVPGLAELRAEAEAAGRETLACYDALALDRAARRPLDLVRAVDGFIERTRPFDIAKDDGRRRELEAVLRGCLEALRIAAHLLVPVLPERATELLHRLGERSEGGSLRERLAWGLLPQGATLEKGEPLFPRRDPLPETSLAGEGASQAATEGPAEVDIEAFAALDLRIARVVAAEPLPKADRLLRLELELDGGDRRTVLSGIRSRYEGPELVGRQVLYLANLAPRKIRGVVSQGMVLAASGEDGRPVLLGPECEVPAGTRVT